ncbi:hypothetical protein BGZ51_002142 [Haplosporangium sp. Z 767]|nr:hypothetical protein BGZ51_002142 [Haplosporangium sp. Z 767]KAF9195197.1 hypothetical protein BGZ50_005031 [Haplosporangium sp. Z 11]
MEEFIKLKEQLLPHLVRYSQSPTPPLMSRPSDSKSASRHGQEEEAASHPINSQTPLTQPNIYPKASTLASSSTVHAEKCATSRPSQSISATAPKPKRTVVKKEPSTSTLTSQTNKSRELVANKAKGSNKKRPKIEVYQDHDQEKDKDVVSAKRRRVRAKGADADFDKENKNPLEKSSTRPEVKALGEITNTAKPTRGLNPKGKSAVQKAPSTKSNVKPATTTPTTPAMLPETRTHAEVYPATAPVVTPSAKDPPKHVKTIKSPGTIAFNNRHRDSAPCPSTIAAAPSTNKHTIAGPPEHVSRESPQLIIKQEPEEERTNVQSFLHEAASTMPKERAVIEIPGSVEDDSSQDSFERSIKSERQATSPMDHFQDTEEIQDSQPSQDMHSTLGSQETTFPMPDFLTCGFAEDLERDNDRTLVKEEGEQDSHQYLKLDRIMKSTNDATLVKSNLSQGSSTVTSTAFVDGVWCIDDYKHGVTSTVCGHQDEWIAVETSMHVQFWQLHRHDLSKGQWYRRIQLNKESDHPIQVIFAPDDSFVVVLRPNERSYLKLQLQDVSDWAHQDVNRVEVSWIGAELDMQCQGVMIKHWAGSEDSCLLVLGADEPGTICVVPVPGGADKGVLKLTVEAEYVHCIGLSHTVSSLVSVQNTESLVLASFGTSLVLWDLKNHSEPVSIADAALTLHPSAATLRTDPYIMPLILSATIPAQFFEECKEDLPQPSLWPILTVLQSRVRDGDDYEKDTDDECSMYAMKGNAIDLVHKYRGSNPVSFASSSPRMVACQIDHDGKTSLCLWDILKSDLAIRLSLLEAPSHGDVATRKSLQQKLWNRQISPQDLRTENESQVARDNDLVDIFSSVSTLSPPPEALSSSHTTTEGKTDESKEHPVIHVEEPAQSTASKDREKQPMDHVVKKPEEWIELTSVSWMEREQVQFSVHCEQRWVVVIQQDRVKVDSSVIHILDLEALLSTV